MHVYGAFCIHYRRKVKNTSIGSNHDICHEFSARPYSFQDRIGHGIGPSLRRMIQHYLEPGDKNTITSSAVRSGIYMKLCYVKITSRLHIFGHTHAAKTKTDLFSLNAITCILKELTSQLSLR